MVLTWTVAVTVSLDWPTITILLSSIIEATRVKTEEMGRCQRRRARGTPQLDLPLPQSGGTCSSKQGLPREREEAPLVAQEGGGLDPVRENEDGRGTWST